MNQSIVPAAPESGAVASGGGATSVARRLAAIAFLDIVGYTTLMAEDEARTHADWMRILGEIIRPTSHRHRGKIVKSTGDGVLAEFPSALDSVEWARDVQRLVRGEARRSNAPSTALALRCAVHVGDVMTTADDIYGDGVNVTARLQEHAEPGGIVLSEAIYDLVRGNLHAPARDLGLIALKNLPTPVRAYALDPETGTALEPQRARASALPSIAVLPLVNLGGKREHDYFAEGIVEDIIVSLSNLRELVVIARTSALTVGRRHADVRELGRALGVRYVVTGSVRRSDGRVRVSMQLHDVRTGASLWGDTTELAPGELFELQDRTVQRIVAGIAPHLRAAELRNALRKRPENFTAYEHTLRALEALNSLEKPVFLQAREHLDRAMAEDPGFAMPVAWAARWYSLLIGQGWSADRAGDAQRAAALATRAIDLDRQNAVGLATYGHVRSFLFHDCDSALIYFDRALTACPNSALAWILLSGTQSYIGRADQAVRSAEHAVSLSPFDQNLFYYYNFLALAHYAGGAFEDAVKWCRMSLNENPRYTATLRFLAASLSALGRTDEAADPAARLLALEPAFTLAVFQRLVPFRDPAMKARYLAHLKAAGLPH